MQPISVSTALVVGFAFHLLAAVSLVGTWQAGRAYPGLRQWALAAILSTVSAPLIAARPVLPLALSAIGGSGLYVAASALVLVGLHRFTGSGPALGRGSALVLAAAGGAFLYFVFARPSVGARVVLFSACTAWLAARTSWHCLRKLGAAFGAPARFLAALLGALAACQAARLVVAAAVTAGGADPELFARTQAESLLLLATIVFWAVVLFALPSLQQRRLMLDLERSDAQVRKLEGILPICMHCKRIRDAGDSWQVLEEYIGAHSGAAFSHCLCPDCVARYYPDAGLR
ncbi:MAG: hypothetical protein HZB56_11920 [Deltaproteobacteria bacterium]|nr:hypothetical protein [Deltaproteobacteria bacterium]